MNETTAYELFKSYVDGFPTKTAAADKLEISLPYLLDLYAGQRRLSDNILERIGLTRETVIKKVS